MALRTRRDVLFLVLGGFFLTNALLGELIGGKLFFLGDPEFSMDLGAFALGPFVMSVGVVPWPVVFLTTDLVNEYFGTRGVRQLTFLGIGMISYAFLVLFLALQIPATGFSPVVAPEVGGPRSSQPTGARGLRPSMMSRICCSSMVS